MAGPVDPASARRQQLDSSPAIVELRAVGRSDLAIAGGKGANLGELIRAGFPVSSGFIVTTAAYERFVAANDLDDPIAQGLAGGPERAADIRDAFERCSISP